MELKMPQLTNYLYILATIIFTVYGQLILKWRIHDHGNLPYDLTHKIKFLFFLLIDPIIISGFISAFLASIAWMAAMTKFSLSHAYPFMSLNFVIVLLLSNLLLHESISLQRIIGVGLIVFGTIISSRG
jgi:uncharacterized membrane protein